MALMTMFGCSGFSVLYPDLHEAGLTDAREAAELLFGLEDRGWVRVTRYVEQGGGAHRPASERYRRDFLAAHEGIEPSEDPDVDYGVPNLHFELTEEGRAEYLDRVGPTPEQDAWIAEEGDGELVVWATDEENARRVARRLVHQFIRPKGQRGVFRRRGLEPTTFELDTGEEFAGVRVTYRLRFDTVGKGGDR